MGKSLSLDTRERVVGLVDEVLSCHEAAWRLRLALAPMPNIQRPVWQHWLQRSDSRAAPTSEFCVSN